MHDSNNTDQYWWAAHKSLRTKENGGLNKTVTDIDQTDLRRSEPRSRDYTKDELSLKKWICSLRLVGADIEVPNEHRWYVLESVLSLLSPE